MMTIERVMQRPVPAAFSGTQALQPRRPGVTSPIARPAADRVELRFGHTGHAASPLDLTPDQERFRDTVALAIHEGGAAPKDVKRWDTDKVPPMAIFHKLVGTNHLLTSVPIPALTPTGSEPVHTDNALLTTLSTMELVRRASIGLSVFVGVNAGLAAEAIDKMGTEEQRRHHLNMLNQGVHTYAFGLTEKNVGSDPRSIETTYRWDDQKGVFILNGNKKFIGNAAEVKVPVKWRLDAQGKPVPAEFKTLHRGADYIVVFAVDNPDPAVDPAGKKFLAFLVPRTEIEKQWRARHPNPQDSWIRPTGGEFNKLGLRDVNNGDFVLENLELKPEHVLGWQPNEPLKDIYPELLKVLDESRLYVGAMGVGAAEAAVHHARRYVDDPAKRTIYGNTLNQFQVLDFPLRDLEAEALAAKLLMLDTARMVDDFHTGKITPQHPDDVPYRTATAMAKLYGSELAERAVNRALKTYGGRGFLEDPAENNGIAQRYRDTVVLTIFEGTSDIQRNLIIEGVLREEKKNVPTGTAGRAKWMLQAPVRHHKATRPDASIEDIYRYMAADVMVRALETGKALARDWPAQQYEGWSPKSMNREMKIKGSLPVQKRLHLLADVATYRYVAELADKAVRAIDAKERTYRTHHADLPRKDEHERDLLERYRAIAEVAVRQKLVEYESEALAGNEAAYRRERGTSGLRQPPVS